MFVDELGNNILRLAQVICGPNGERLSPHKILEGHPYINHIEFEAKIGLHLVAATNINDKLEISIWEIIGIIRRVEWCEVEYSSKFDEAVKAVKLKLSKSFGNGPTYYIEDKNYES